MCSGSGCDSGVLHLEYSTDHTEGILCAMVVPGTRTFMCDGCTRDPYFYVRWLYPGPVLLCAMIVPGTCTFMCPPRHIACLLIFFFLLRKYSFGPFRI